MIAIFTRSDLRAGMEDTDIGDILVSDFRTVYNGGMQTIYHADIVIFADFGQSKQFKVLKNRLGMLTELPISRLSEFLIIWNA